MAVEYWQKRSDKEFYADCKKQAEFERALLWLIEHNKKKFLEDIKLECQFQEKVSKHTTLVIIYAPDYAQLQTMSAAVRKAIRDLPSGNTTAPL